MFILIFLKNGYKPQVTIQPVSANNLQTLLSVHLSFYTFEVVHYSMGISSVYYQLINCKGNWHTRACQSSTVQVQESVY